MSTGSLQGRILLVVGRKKAGKTTLIEKLLSALKERGYKMGSIKYTTEDHEFDTPGKDSYRHAQAGAETTMIVSSHKAAIFSNSLRDRELEEVLDFVFQGYDLVLGEGFRSSPYPKIEVHNPDKSSAPLCSPEDNLIALVSSQKVEMGIPCFLPEELDSLVEFIEKRFLKENDS